MSKLSDLADCLKPATDEHGSPVLQSEYDRLRTLLRDWQEWAEWFAGVHHRPGTSLQALKARTQEVLKP